MRRPLPGTSPPARHPGCQPCRRGQLRLGRARAGLARWVAGWAVACIPPGWLAPLAAGLAVAERLHGRPAWQRALEAWCRAPGYVSTPASIPPVLLESRRLCWEDRLEALRTRPRVPPGPPPAHLRCDVLYLSARIGRPRRLLRAVRCWGLETTRLEAAATQPQAAALTQWLGTPALRSTRRVQRALDAGQPVALLLWLPGIGAHATPDLSTRCSTAGEVLQRALQAAAWIARARPDLVDWSQRRGLLRRGVERIAAPSWSRLAPWQAPPRPTARGVVRARGRERRARPEAGATAHATQGEAAGPMARPRAW